MSGYGDLKAHVDDLLAELDRIKAQLVDEERAARAPRATIVAPPTFAATPTPPPPPSAVPPQWAPDPSRTHEQRWWDGVRWTEHVLDAGAQGLDPLP